ncbi:hypothetical protein BBJ28_00017917 [Nothophytophthora sp. Chile5]|nr:hypothetical protein BBJ28_00017917 [Nothophytophthora sp. Chile5]
MAAAVLAPLTLLDVTLGIAALIPSAKFDLEPFDGILVFNDGDAMFYIDHVQRCYTFTKAWSAPAESAKWKEFPDIQGQIAFFEDDDCEGKRVVASHKQKGTANFENTKLYHKEISSVIIWIGSVYPLHGLVHVKKEESAKLATIANDSDANSTFDNYNAHSSSS